MTKTEVAVSNVGIIKTPNQPIYKRFCDEVIKAQRRDQRLVFLRFSKVAVMIFI
jgi:hypothetical protein